MLVKKKKITWENLFFLWGVLGHVCKDVMIYKMVDGRISMWRELLVDLGSPEGGEGCFDKYVYLNLFSFLDVWGDDR